MNLAEIAEILWGKQAKLRYLMFATVVILFTYLGSKEIWTQEHRWADIVSGMFFRHDFLHPYLGEARYYDKPLLSYWLIAGLAQVTGSLSTWVLRLPSALAGWLAVWSIYRLGTSLKDKSLGFLSGWMLLTTFYFVFWARTSSADMLNLAGSVLAIAWYFMRRERGGFFSYFIFFLILALTSLCKGLIGAIVPVLAILTDICLNKSWKQHLRWPLFLALIPALLIYFAPFVASSYFDNNTYGENGLYLVYRENILRYFEPFDHKGPVYTYFLYLPIYLLPWTVLFIPALIGWWWRRKTVTINSKWIGWSLLVIFVFFTLSGSRRSYYVLPMVPFAILFTADWLLALDIEKAKRQLIAAGLTIFGLIFIYLAVDIIPNWYYNRYGMGAFAQKLMRTAAYIKPFSFWKVEMLDAETKLNFYLHLPPQAKNYGVSGEREDQTPKTLLQAWPQLKKLPKDTIYITRARYVPYVQQYFKDFIKVQLPVAYFPFMEGQRANAPVAFIPKDE